MREGEREYVSEGVSEGGRAGGREGGRERWREMSPIHHQHFPLFVHAHMHMHTHCVGIFMEYMCMYGTLAYVKEGSSDKVTNIHDMFT